MGLEMAALGAAVSLAGSEAAAQGITDSAKYNKKITDRNADVLDNRAQQVVFQAGQEIVRFREEFRELNDAAAQTQRKNGVVASSGTALDVLLENAVEAEADIQKIEINAAAQASDLKEQSINERLKGQYAMHDAKNQARAQRIQGVTQAVSTGYSIYTA